MPYLVQAQCQRQSSRRSCQNPRKSLFRSTLTSTRIATGELRGFLGSYERKRFSQQADTQMLQLATPFHGFEHGDLVGVLDVAAHRNAHRDARYFEPGAPQLPGKIGRRGFALDRGIGG